MFTMRRWAQPLRARPRPAPEVVVSPAMSRRWLLVPLSILPLLLLVFPGRASAAPEEPPPPLDVPTLRKALAAPPSGPAAVALVDKLRRWFGPDALTGGMGAKTEGLEAA